MTDLEPRREGAEHRRATVPAAPAGDLTAPDAGERPVEQARAVEGRRDDPIADPARLAALYATRLLDENVVELFDTLARVAGYALGAPVALVNLLTERVQVPKGRFLRGPGAQLELPVDIEEAYCRLVVAENGPLIITDARQHPGVRDNSTTLAGIASYAAAPIRTEDGHVLGTVCVADFAPRPWSADDVTVLESLATVASGEVALRRRAADVLDDTVAALRRSEARFRAALAASPLTVFEQDRALRYTWVHNARSGIADAGVTGRSDPELFSGRDLEQLLALKLRVLETGRGARGEVLLHDARGAELWFDLICEPVRDAAGEVSGITCAAIEITARKHAEAERQRLLERAEAAQVAAERAARVKSEVLATMSHEIRTPLNAIMGYGELLDLGIAGPVTDRQREYLSRLSESSRHLLTLIDDVLDLAKLDAERMAVAREEHAAADAVHAALALVAPQAAAKRLHVREGCAPARAPDAPRYLGDEQRVRQVLVNLLSNAVKFTEREGTVTVTCTASETGPPDVPLSTGGVWTAIAVSDTGIGIEPEQHDAVFEPFVQASQGKTRTYGGTGLGLAISRRIARLMGGDLTLRSAPGEGSTFTLWLPGTVGTRRDEAPPAIAPTLTSAARPWGAEPAGVDAPPRRPSGLAGFMEVGLRLATRAGAVFARVAARLNAEFPDTTRLTRAQLEDHFPALLADVAQLFVVLEEEPSTGWLLSDGMAIQRFVAERHGEQRHQLGWTEHELRRELAILGKELERAATHDEALPATPDDAAHDAVPVLRRVLARVLASAVLGFRRAESAAAEREPVGGD